MPTRPVDSEVSDYAENNTSINKRRDNNGDEAADAELKPLNPSVLPADGPADMKKDKNIQGLKYWSFLVRRYGKGRSGAILVAIFAMVLLTTAVHTYVVNRSSYSLFKDISDLEKGRSGSDDTPVFWHIPKAGGSTVKGLLMGCHKMVIATDFGRHDGHDHDKEIALFNNNGMSSINVDVTTPEGIKRAKFLGLAKSGLAQVVVTSEIYKIASIFDKSHSGVVFGMFRHPIDRAVSMYNYLSTAIWEDNSASFYLTYGRMGIEEYSSSDLGEESNWMVRMITNKRTGHKVTREDLEAAKEFLRKKVLVGLISEMEESIDRYEMYFNWKYEFHPVAQENCRTRKITNGTNVNTKIKRVETPKPGSVAYERLTQQNVLDIELYEYAEALFKEQKNLFVDYPDIYRAVNATCCKCDGTCPDGVL